MNATTPVTSLGQLLRDKLAAANPAEGNKRFFAVLTGKGPVFYTTDVTELAHTLATYPQASVETLWCEENITTGYGDAYIVTTEHGPDYDSYFVTTYTTDARKMAELILGCGNRKPSVQSITIN